MGWLTSLSFAAPWALPALIILPLLWWLLRATPPPPRRLPFPPVRLLMALKARQETPARTPWWLVLLRLALAALVILAVAHPLLNAAGRPALPILLAIDDGWGAARSWQARQEALDAILTRAERERLPVALLPTAPPAGGGPIEAGNAMAAGEARAVVQAMAPKPWPADHGAAREALKGARRDEAWQVVWLSDGLDGPGTVEFLSLLRTLGRVEVVTETAANLPRLLLPPADAKPVLAPLVRRAHDQGEERVAVLAQDGRGRVVGRAETVIPAGAVQAEAPLDLPSELRNRVARLAIEGEASAGAVALLDERWRRRPVGVLTGESTDAPLLAGGYYVERALVPFAEIRRGAPAALLSRDLAVAVLPDEVRLTADERAALAHWVEGGGMLLRFAGPNLARAPDDLLPVRLREGGRTLGGALSWSAPAALAPFPPTGPLAGLTVPADVRVATQVLAEPEIDLDAKTWARLADGTPLVTAQASGQGMLVLVHTSADPSWSNLAMSGLHVDMLRRMVAASRGVAVTSANAERPLAPLETLDGQGRLGSPPPAAAAIASGKLAEARPGPRHPPGFYGEDAARRAFNLGPTVTLKPLALPRGVDVTLLGSTRPELDLRPWLLAAALALFVLDMLAGLALRGLFRRRAAHAALLVVLALAARPAQADDAQALAAGLETRLAFVQTGDAAADRVTRAGLAGLTGVLARRTTAALGEPMAVDLENDPLVFFPLVYWAVNSTQGQPSEQARGRINEYLRNGGMILLDTADSGEGELRRLTEGLAIPPLAAVGDEHVLTRSFYLLREMPGRYAGNPVWAERGDETVNDGVSSVIVGGNGWAGAWAVDGEGRALLPVVPGGERQRELAVRFGVNLVMYALTGNYKADQVHVPAIMERLGQ